MRNTRRSLTVPERDSPAGPRELRSPARRTTFMVGKYTVVAQPIPDSAHMLRYTVSVGGTRIGATLSVPSESDCCYLEKPPVVPSLKPFHATYRPGRPKKSALPAVTSEPRQGIRAEDAALGLSLRELGVTEDR